MSRISLLGPMKVECDDGPVHVGGRKQCAVLAMLALQVGQVVSVNAVIDGLWMDPPAGAINNVHAYMSRLRRLEDPAAAGRRVLAISRRGPGYMLQADPETVDTARFDRLFRDGAASLPSDPDRASNVLRDALDLWRGEPLADFSDEPFAAGEAIRLSEQRLAATTARIEADLHLGRHAMVVGELRGLVQRHPLDEHLVMHLMVSLYRSGRQAEALEVYQQGRRRFIDDLGIEPGSSLRNLEAAILASDPNLQHPSVPGTSSEAWAAAGEKAQAVRSASRAWNVPARTVRYCGREDLMTVLRDALESGGRAAVHALHGMGGIGKSTTALEYAHRFAADYDIAWWISSETPALMKPKLAELARAIGLAADSADENASLARLFGELGARGRWLLIFDNVEDPATMADLLPTGTGHTVITSRNPDWLGIATGIPLHLFRRSESVAVLQGRLPGLARTDAEIVAAALDDLPLAVDQAASLLADTGISAKDYLRLLTDRTEETLGHSFTTTSYAKAWSVAVDRLAVDDPRALDLLTLVSWLAPEPIPLDMLTAHPGVMPPDLSSVVTDALALHRVTTIVRRRGMARVLPTSIHLHRLSAALLRARSWDRGSWPTIATKLVLACFADIPQHPAPDGSTPPRYYRSVDASQQPRWRALLPHMLAVVAPDRRDADIDDDQLTLLLGTAGYLITVGDLLTARNILEWTHQVLSERRDSGSPEFVDATSMLADALAVSGERDRAGLLRKQVLDHRRSTLGRNHFLTLRAETYHAITLWSQHEYRRARRLNQGTYNRACRLLGQDAPLSLIIANGLAINWASLRQWEKARRLHEDTINRAIRIFGAEDYGTLSFQVNLAADLRGLGEVERARALDLAMFRQLGQLVGFEHLDTLGIAAALALDLSILGYHREARLINEEVVAKYTRTQGPDYVFTLCAAHQLAENYRDLGILETALRIDQDVYNRLKRARSADDPFTLTSAHNLATDLAALGEHRRALELDLDTLTRRRAVLGDDDPATKATAQNLLLDIACMADVSGSKMDHTERWFTRMDNGATMFI